MEQPRKITRQDFCKEFGYKTILYGNEYIYRPIDESEHYKNQAIIEVLFNVDILGEVIKVSKSKTKARN